MGTKLVMVIPIIAIFILLPHNAFAVYGVVAGGHADKYNMGWNDGENDVQYNYVNNYGYDLQCTHHTHWYCVGYVNGYNDYWNRAHQTNNVGNNDRQDSGQSSDIRINGNNNRVEVTQNDNQANQSPQDNTGGDNGSNIGNGY